MTRIYGFQNMHMEKFKVLMPTICAKLVLTAITHILTISEIYVYPSHE